MKIIDLKLLFFSFFFLQFSLIVQAQSDSLSTSGHFNNNKFKQLKGELATPNSYRTASGAPGRDYYQQKVDYVMDIELDDENQKIYGEEEITYTNNSSDDLSYFWIQLDQNIRKKHAPALEKNGEGAEPIIRVETFVNTFFKESLKFTKKSKRWG